MEKIINRYNSSNTIKGGLAKLLGRLILILLFMLYETRFETLILLSSRFLATLVQLTELQIVWSVSNCIEYSASETDGDFAVNFEFNRTLSYIYQDNLHYVLNYCN